MGLAGVSLGRELRALALSHTALRCGVAPPENSVTNSRADCALTQQTVGGTKAISPCVEPGADAVGLAARGALWQGTAQARQPRARCQEGDSDAIQTPKKRLRRKSQSPGPLGWYRPSAGVPETNLDSSL